MTLLWASAHTNIVAAFHRSLSMKRQRDRSKSEMYACTRRHLERYVNTGAKFTKDRTRVVHDIGYNTAVDPSLDISLGDLDISRSVSRSTTSTSKFIRI